MGDYIFLSAQSYFFVFKKMKKDLGFGFNSRKRRQSWLNFFLHIYYTIFQKHVKFENGNTD